MKRVKTALVLLGCSLLMSSCLYEQKRVVNPAAQMPPEHGAADQRPDLVKKDTAVKAAPVQEVDLSSTAGQTTPGPVPGLSEAGVMPSVEYVSGRIGEYNKKMDRWRERDSQAAVLRIPAAESEKMVRCFRDLQKVLNGYVRLHDVLLQRTSVPVPGNDVSLKELYELQQSDIAFVDGVCGQMVAEDGKGGGWMKSETPGKLPPEEALIVQHAARGEFEDLVQVWRQMPEETAARVRLSTKLAYGNALMALQQEEEAIKVYRQLVEQMTTAEGQPADLLAVQKILADLYVATEKYKDAEAQYIDISKRYKDMARVEEWTILQRSILERGEQGRPELKEYSDLLRNYLGFNPAKDGYTVVWQADKYLQSYPQSPVASNVDLIRTAARELADKWSKNVLTEADKLAEQKKYQDALGKLQTVPSTMVSPETQQQVSKKTGDVTLAQKLEKETTQLEKTQALERQWNEGMRLMEASQYDKAIETFTPMLDTAYAAKADKKIAEASLLAAEAERRRAADIFIRFTKAADVESKKKLLIESRRCLLDILVKYPEVEITEKVIGNIKRVEKEMNAIDPSLVKDSGRVGDEVVGAGRKAPASSSPEASGTGTGASGTPIPAGKGVPAVR